MGRLKKYKWLDLSIFSVKVVYLSLIILICLFLIIIKPITLYISCAIIFLSAILLVYICFREFKNSKYRINELSKCVDSVLKKSLDTIDVPIAIVSEGNQIIWQNNVCKHIIPNEVIYDCSSKVTRQKEKKYDSLNTNIDIGNGEIYEVIVNRIKFSDFDCFLISFINRTEESILKKALEDTKTAVGILFVDNYEETMQGLEDIERAEISSKLEKEIRNWISDNKGVLNKLDKDRYVVLVDRKQVDQMEKDSFKILEKIKKITDKTKLPLTISLGISYSESTLDERYTASTSALDIALGRGGDQVVVKKDKKFDFYGGSNLGLEKTSKVRSRTISQALKELIEKVDKVYITGHKNTDIDCIGASIGIYKIAKSLNKEAYIITDTKLASSTQTVLDRIKENEEYNEVIITKDELKKQDYSNSLLIVVDTHKKSYLPMPELVDMFEKKVVIDHHRRGPEFIEDALLTYHEIYASSTCELISEILMYLDNIELTPREAECIYAGIVIDTKNFTFKTGVRTFEVAAYLKRFGLDLTEVKQIFQNDFATYIAKVNIVKNAEVIKGQIAISLSEETYDDMPVIAAQAADELLSISGILASFVLCKVDDVVMISGRSMGDINVQAIMEKIGGGGHLTFAGAQIAGVEIEEAKKRLLNSIDEYFGN